MALSTDLGNAWDGAGKEHMTFATTAFKAEIHRMADEMSGIASDSGLKTDQREAALKTLAFQKRHMENRLREAENADAETREADAFVRNNPDHEKRAETLRGSAALPNSDSGDNSDEWRSILPSRSEMRAQSEGTDTEGGFTVPTGVRGRVIDLLRAKTRFLQALPAENLVNFDTKDLVLPQITSTTPPAGVAEHTTINEAPALGFGGPSFEAKSYKQIRSSSNELLADSAADMRSIVANAMLRDAGVQFDSDLWNGDGSVVTGLLGQGTQTTLSGVDCSYDDIANAIEAIEGISGEATAVFASPDQAGALRREREGANGAYLGGGAADNVRNLAWNLPRFVSANLPVNTVAVVDMSRVYAGIRQDVTIRASEHARFEDDALVWRMVFRAAGVLLAEQDSAQVITADGV